MATLDQHQRKHQWTPAQTTLVLDVAGWHLLNCHHGKGIQLSSVLLCHIAYIETRVCVAVVTFWRTDGFCWICPWPLSGIPCSCLSDQLAKIRGCELSHWAYVVHLCMLGRLLLALRPSVQPPWLRPRSLEPVTHLRHLLAPRHLPRYHHPQLPQRTWQAGRIQPHPDPQSVVWTDRRSSAWRHGDRWSSLERNWHLTCGWQRSPWLLSNRLCWRHQNQARHASCLRLSTLNPLEWHMLVGHWAETFGCSTQSTWCQPWQDNCRHFRQTSESTCRAPVQHIHISAPNQFGPNGLPATRWSGGWISCHSVSLRIDATGVSWRLIHCSLRLAGWLTRYTCWMATPPRATSPFGCTLANHHDSDQTMAPGLLTDLEHCWNPRMLLPCAQVEQRGVL